MSATRTLQWLGDYIECIDAELEKMFPKDPATTLERAVVDSLSSGGKRVRAVLALLWCEMFSGEYRAAIPAAVAYELAHASALVQDDIIDSSETRRGSKSIVAKYGLSQAILASDLLLFNVPKLIAKYDALESRRLAKLFDLVGEACRGATWGEFLDLEIAKSDHASEMEYEEMIRCKTATLLSAPCASGAIIGGASEEGIHLAHRFGEWLGMAYQIQDDALDLMGSEEALGKPVFSDVRAGKKNILLIHCFGRCSEAERAFLASLFQRTGEYDEKEKSKARGILQRHGSVSYAHSRALHHVEQAKRVLAMTRECQAKNSLLELSDYLAERYY
jgi:geranylgeranyl pyrophosphate synthase